MHVSAGSYLTGTNVLVPMCVSPTVYITASEAAKEDVWIRKFLIELGVFPNASSLLDLYCDNSGAIAQAKEPRNH